MYEAMYVYIRGRTMIECAELRDRKIEGATRQLRTRADDIALREDTRHYMVSINVPCYEIGNFQEEI